MCMICVYMCGRAGGHAGRFAAAVHVDHGPEELGRRHHVLVRRFAHQAPPEATLEAWRDLCSAAASEAAAASVPAG